MSTIREKNSTGLVEIYTNSEIFSKKNLLIVIDQLDKINVKGTYARTDEKLRQIYTSTREIAKRRNCAVIAISQASADAHNRNSISFDQMENSKTGKAAEADLMILIAKNPQVEGQDEEDAQRAIRCGADALVVSNHGGRQLDGASSSISMLSSIVESVGKETEVWIDGGITSGQDVLKAFGLGAKGTLIGRPYLYGLGALGEEGVERCLEIIKTELDKSMALCGHTNINEVNYDIIRSTSF